MGQGHQMPEEGQQEWAWHSPSQKAPARERACCLAPAAGEASCPVTARAQVAVLL